MVAVHAIGQSHQALGDSHEPYYRKHPHPPETREDLSEVEQLFTAPFPNRKVAMAKPPSIQIMRSSMPPPLKKPGPEAASEATTPKCWFARNAKSLHPIYMSVIGRTVAAPHRAATSPSSISIS